METNIYKEEIQNLKKYALENNITEEEVNKLFKEYFLVMNKKTSSKTQVLLKCIRVIILIFLTLTLSTFVLYNHPKTHNLLLRNLQSYIYPGLRIFRKVAVPIITVYPSLTDWYDEWCLVENPYFKVNEMDCWPCSSVNVVQDLTGYNITQNFNTGIPFMRVEETEKIDMNKLSRLYNMYQDIFDLYTEKVESNQITYKTINNVMQNRIDIHPFSNRDTHIQWRINRMEPGRKLRRLFSKLPGVPDWWSPSTEKFILIDEPWADGYDLPNPECANVIVQCTSGERLIELNPSPECTQHCNKISILLSTQQSLWYNWWYWRPISFPSANNTTETTIFYVTSFC